MKRLLYMTMAIMLFAAYGCASSGDVVYTGANQQAREGNWIKDPEAVGTTRDTNSRQDTTRTESNRVDIPVLEYAEVSCTTSGAAAMRRSGYDARYVRVAFEGVTLENFTQRLTMAHGFNRSLTSETLWARANATEYPGLFSNDEVNARLGRDRFRAYSAEDQAWTNTGKVATEGIKSRAYVQAVRGEAYIEAMKTRSGYDAAFASRVVGVHLWKYADREVVGNNVEITYTLVYYNTNEFDTGPTEIDEPVPYYTTYVKKSATLPKEGTSVEYLERDDARNILRWKFPKGIEAGETNSMTYKVTVKLNAPPEYRPPQDQPGEARKQ